MSTMPEFSLDTDHLGRNISDIEVHIMLDLSEPF